MTKMKEAVVAETEAYCKDASIQGLVYFFSERLTKVEKIFWIISVIVMLALSFLLVRQSVNAWEENPTTLRTISTDNPTSDIQFPTITICNDFTPDKFGFARNVMNALKFQCSVFNDCNETLSQRGYFSTSSYKLDINLIDSRRRDYVDETRFPASLIGRLKGLPGSALYSKESFYHKRYDLIRDSIDNSDRLESYMECKLIAGCDNYDILSYLRVRSPPPAKFYFTSDPDEFNITDEEHDLVILTYLILALPLPGRLGTFAYNFKSYKWSPNMGLFFTDDMGTYEFFQSLFNTMSNVGVDQDLGISPSDIAAILSPTISYTIDQIFPRQFQDTVDLQMEATNTTDNSLDIFVTESFDYVNAYFPVPPAFLSSDNYFGKLLGPYLKQVMEVMFHCLLRAKPVSVERFLLLQDLYGSSFNKENVTLNCTNPGCETFSLNIMKPPFYPRWKDYKAFNKTPYFWLMDYAMDNYPFNNFLTYENGIGQYNSAMYNSLFNPDETIEELKKRYQYQNILALCNGPGNRTCDGKFQATLTDTAVCETFNALDFNSTFKNSTYSQMFEQIFQPESNGDNILTNEDGGKMFKMFLVLDSHQSKVVGHFPGTFRVGISNIFGLMGVRDTSVEVSNGFFTKISVTPIQYKTTDGARQYVNCRYFNDTSSNQSIFKFYSEEACKFECSLNHSREMCGCTPWNYPQYGNGTITEICDGPKSYCFEDMMDGSYDCGCMPDCEKIEFSVRVSPIQLNYVQECSAPKNIPFGMSRPDYDLRLIVGEKLRHMDGEEFLFWYNKIMNNESVVDDLLSKNKFYRYVDPRLTVDECQFLLKNDFALLSIQVSAPTFSVIEQGVSSSFTDKIASIGGTLSLFTGIGILSLIEIVFLIYRITFNLRKGNVILNPKISAGARR